jgi:hypothetical protein
MTRPQVSPVNTWLQVGVILASIFLCLMIAYNFFRSYFSIEGTAVPSQQNELDYKLFAAFAIGVPLVGSIYAFATRRWVFGSVHVVLVVVSLLFAYVLSVPVYEWFPKPVEHHLPSDYHPCYSGANNCD